MNEDWRRAGSFVALLQSTQRCNCGVVVISVSLGVVVSAVHRTGDIALQLTVAMTMSDSDASLSTKAWSERDPIMALTFKERNLSAFSSERTIAVMLKVGNLGFSNIFARTEPPM